MKEVAPYEDIVSCELMIPVETLGPVIRHGLQRMVAMGWIWTYGIGGPSDRPIPETIGICEERTEKGVADRVMSDSDWYGAGRLGQFILKYPHDWASIVTGQNWDVAAPNLMQFMLYGELRYA